MFPALWGKIRRPTFHGYTTATRFAPGGLGVGAGIMVFEGGINSTKSGSITGGGQIYGREYQAMHMGNIIVANAPGFYSITGPGQIPYDAAALQALSGGKFGVGS